jgi:HlyD family secretion protein
MLLAAASFGASSVWNGLSGARLAPRATAQEEPARPVRHAVAARGRIEPRGEVIEVGAAPSDRIELVAVAEGDLVAKDGLLARLESRAERERDRDRVASVLSEARTRLAAVTATGEATIEEAGLRLATVEKLAPLEIESQESTLRAAEALARFAELQLERQGHLQERQAGTAEEYDRRVWALRDGEETVARARSALTRLRAARDLDARLARAQLATARASLDRARSELPVDSLSRELALAEERLRRTELRSPVAGRVLKVLAHAGEATGRPIMRIADTREMVVIAEIYETDVRFVAVGQTVRVTSPALPVELAGVVDRVGTIVAKNALLETDPAADADARVVEVRVRLDDSQVASRFVNLQCTALVSIGSSP